MDGFDIGSDYTLKGILPATENELNYGYIWMSQPCGGIWTIEFKEIDRAYSVDETKQLNVYTRVKIEGYSENPSDVNPVHTIDNKALFSRNITDGLIYSGAATVSHTKIIPVDADAEFTYCL
jgi:hypothetical protein